jgi:hypothetical protein
MPQLGLWERYNDGYTGKQAELFRLAPPVKSELDKFVDKLNNDKPDYPAEKE